MVPNFTLYPINTIEERILLWRHYPNKSASLRRRSSYRSKHTYIPKAFFLNKITGAFSSIHRFNMLGYFRLLGLSLMELAQQRFERFIVLFTNFRTPLDIRLFKGILKYPLLFPFRLQNQFHIPLAFLRSRHFPPYLTQSRTDFLLRKFGMIIVLGKDLLNLPQALVVSIDFRQMLLIISKLSPNSVHARRGVARSQVIDPILQIIPRIHSDTLKISDGILHHLQKQVFSPAFHPALISQQIASLSLPHIRVFPEPKQLFPFRFC